MDDLTRKLRARIIEPLRAVRVVHQTGFVNFGIILIRKDDLVALDLNLTDLALLRHGHERAVIDLLHLLLRDIRHRKRVEKHQHKHHDQVIICQILFWFLHLMHGASSFVLL